MTPAINVAARPAKPLLIYDGNCNFCKFWVLRWRAATEGRVDFIASQDARVAREFPELPRKIFDEAVQLIETNGSVFGGAEAALRTLAYGGHWAFALWLYQDVPGLQMLSEAAYRFVAKRRAAFSFLTRLLWGNDGALPDYSLVRWVFLRLLGIVYLCALLSLGTQITGLIGSNGVSPATDFMAGARQQFDQQHLGWERHYLLPTLCWINASDGFLKFLCSAGSALAVLVIADFAPALCLFLLWVIYLSLVCVGGDFLSFQWDALLLETGFLAIFFAPLRILPRLKRALPPSRIMLWLLRWLLFRLMFESGLVKLLSHDLTWRNLTALNFHYETQPLPTWIGWYAHQLPGAIQKSCVFLMFIIELAAPFLMFAPRKLRFTGCALLVLLQVCILLTGNYCFFNLLTLALCVLLLDDAFLARWMPARLRKRFLPAAATHAYCGEGKTPAQIIVPLQPAVIAVKRGNWPTWVIWPVALGISLVSFGQVLAMLNALQGVPPPWVRLEILARPLQSVNRYGLFAVMTTSRREIVIEGSDDGHTWLPYGFKYKPGDPQRPPAFVAPHQPRLDWQMWFAALGTYRENGWLVNCCTRLLQGSPEVLALFGNNPFPHAPPRYIRAEVYDFHFSNWRERRATGIWWRREYQGEYLPALSLREN